jgi:hypothetical protein
MKKAVLIICLLFVGLMANAQSWNPYVSQGIISPSPLLPSEFGGEGVASFKIGNTGSSPLVYNNSSADNITVVIRLLNGVPNNKYPLQALQGSWKNKFSWTYDVATTTYTGVQLMTLSAYGQGAITVGYRVKQNTSLSVIANGVSASIEVPPYVNASNTTQDDFVSSFTYVLAKDFGDAPLSYGEASHDINLNKTDGAYTQYMHLGRTVDEEFENQPSIFANGDGDDEDGVSFPSLIAGTTVVIPVVVKIHDESFGVLNAWFDWNGDGDFNDLGENVIAPLPVFESGTYDLSVIIPENAIITAATYARFRIGNMSGPTGINSWGEVEDYRVKIKVEDLSDTISLFVRDVNSTLKSLGSTNVLVFPNPAVDRYAVAIDVIGTYKLELIDMLGRVLYNDTIEVQSDNGGVKEFLRGNLPSGQYFLRVSNKIDGAQYTVKLLMAD